MRRWSLELCVLGKPRTVKTRVVTVLSFACLPYMSSDQRGQSKGKSPWSRAGRPSACARYGAPPPSDSRRSFAPGFSPLSRLDRHDGAARPCTRCAFLPLLSPCVPLHELVPKANRAQTPPSRVMWSILRHGGHVSRRTAALRGRYSTTMSTSLRPRPVDLAEPMHPPVRPLSARRPIRLLRPRLRRHVKPSIAF